MMCFFLLLLFYIYLAFLQQQTLHPAPFWVNQPPSPFCPLKLNRPALQLQLFSFFIHDGPIKDYRLSAARTDRRTFVVSSFLKYSHRELVFEDWCLFSFSPFTFTFQTPQFSLLPRIFENLCK
ncbi:hypothetical protein ACMYSQ_001416 [Aspergillus niger]